MRRRIVTFGLACASACSLAQQQSIGSVGIADATVAGALEVSNGRALLLGASTVTARDHTAEVALNRGGIVRVCATSGLHLNAGKGAIDAPLMLALDRGAVEITTRATTNDVVITPDLRFNLKSAGPLDLSLRVARNGDTCVDNRGAAAPVLSVADQFGESSYELHAGQHVLFEHGSLKEVVDNEHEPCGCPPAPVVSVADAGVTGATPAVPGTVVAAEAPKSAAAQSAAEQHPFPAAVSAGLAAPSAPPQTPQGEVHAQVSSTMSYGTGGASDGTGTDTASSGVSAASAPTTSTTAPTSSNTAPSGTNAEPATSTATVRAETPPTAPAPPPADVFHSIGRFFKKLFGGH